jgi:acyl carrier protein
MPVRCDIVSAVRQLIADNFMYRQGDDSLSESTSLLDSGLIDSTGVLELLMLLEKTFAIRVADEEVVPENLDSIGRIAAYVGRKMHAIQEAVAHAG